MENISEQSAGLSGSGTATLINSTVSGNGAIWAGNTSGIEGGGSWTLINSTVVASGNAFAIHYFGQLNATNSLILAPGSPIGTCEDDGTTVSGGGNIESPSDNTCGFNAITDRDNVPVDDLNLGPLQDNGGPTMTHALMPGSAAIDWIQSSMCEVDEDQRGEPRPGGIKCDVGAFEAQQ